jgi:hypothetical protein
MDNLKVATELWIFMLQTIKAMGTTGHDFLDIVGIKNLNIALTDGLEQVLITHAASRVATTILLVTQNAKVNSRRLENSGSGLGYLHIPVIKGSSATHPVQHIYIAIF